MKRMKETSADELKGKRIRIISDDVVATHATFIRLDTGEIIENIRSARLEWDAGRILSVTLWLIHVDYANKCVAQETVVLNNPELDVHALVYREDAANEEMWDQEIYLIRSLADENERLRAELAQAKLLLTIQINKQIEKG